MDDLPPPHTQLLANLSKPCYEGCLKGSELPESCIELFPVALDAQNQPPVAFGSLAIDTQYSGYGGARASKFDAT